AVEAVPRPHARIAADRRLQPRMLSDQGRHKRPGRQPEQGLDEARSEKGTGAEASASCPAECVKLRDERREFRRVQKCCDVADDRATRYLASCHWSYTSDGHA